MKISSMFVRKMLSESRKATRSYAVMFHVYSLLNEYLNRSLYELRPSVFASNGFCRFGTR